MTYTAQDLLRMEEGTVCVYVGSDGYGHWPEGSLVSRHRTYADDDESVGFRGNNGNWNFVRVGEVIPYVEEQPSAIASEGEHTGGSSSYYGVQVENPTTEGNPPYFAECNDIIEALGMNFAEGNAFKAIWRTAAAKHLGKLKKGNNTVYDAEKVVFFGGRMLAQAKFDQQSA